MKGVDDKFWCTVHQRQLTWYEYRAEACFWCAPEKIPWDETSGREGKGWEERRKIWRQLREMPESERQALIPPPGPGPGVTTPSQAWLAEYSKRSR